jgi:hypothetical protein
MDDPPLEVCDHDTMDDWLRFDDARTLVGVLGAEGTNGVAVTGTA